MRMRTNATSRLGRALGHAVVLALFGLVLLASAPARAQYGVDAQRFRPALDSYGIFMVERARTSKQFDFGFKLSNTFLSKPLRLVLSDAKGVKEEREVLSYLDVVNLQMHFGLTDRIEFAIDVPVMRSSMGAGFGKPQDPIRNNDGTFFFAPLLRQNDTSSNGGPGDTRLGLKARVVEQDAFSLAAQLVATLPFGDEASFLGSSSFTYEPKLVAEITKGSVSIAANAGARLHQNRQVVFDPEAQAAAAKAGTPFSGKPILAESHEVILAVGALYRVNPYFSAAAEFMRSQAVAAPAGAEGDSPNDLMFGFHVYPASDFSIALAGGTSVGDSARKDAFRVMAGVAWAPEGEQATSGADRDKDGVPDEKDLCPDEPEDKDGFQDDDGCPDPDNDRDGVPDKLDKCPNEAEDRDGFQDEDGCPDPDNDGDGIPDVVDKCPNEAEDKDGFQDEDGCPDRDNDGDGIPDEKDKCPNEPETVNGIDDEDGCPDAGTQTKLESISERVPFPANKATLDSAGSKSVDRVVDLLKQHADVQIRIEGHADPSGKPGKLDALSAARAEAVREYLIRKGIRADRINSAVGYGGKRPLTKGGTKADRAKNDRVEFIVTRSGQ